MGGLSSKQFKDLMEDDFPPTPPLEKRTLAPSFDPRSPSCEITRTPIQVDKTPDLLLDPRSPTAGITRTPIYAGNGPQPVEVDNTPVKVPSSGPLDLDDYEDIPSPGNDQSPSHSEAVAPSSDSGIQNDSESSVELMSRSCSEPDLVCDDKILLKRPTSARKSSKSSIPIINKKKPKALFYSNTNMSAGDSQTKDKPSPRSPLSVLAVSPVGRQGRRKEVDTPKAILQRKQASKLAMAKGSSGDKQFRVYYDDKENVSVEEWK